MPAAWAPGYPTRAATFEKRHFGVFINVTAMTVEEAQPRMERGERADVYSFPMGWGYMERFAPLPELETGVKPALADTGSQDRDGVRGPLCHERLFFADQ